MKEKFAIKFGLSKKHAENLINKGELHFNCAKYYQNVQESNSSNDFGDNSEGVLLSIIRQNQDLPIYCLYLAWDENICKLQNQLYIKVSSRMKGMDFKDKYIVVILFDKLLERLKDQFNNKDIRVGTVKYTIKNAPNVKMPQNKLEKVVDEEAMLITNKQGENLFRKNYRFAYQQELRIVFGNDDRFNQNEILNGKNYYINDISSFSYMLPIKKIYDDGSFMYIPILDKEQTNE